MSNPPRCLAALAASTLALCAGRTARSDGDLERAPCAPVAEARGGARGVAPKADPVQWSIGEPSAEAQELLELMNRARRDPVAEGDRIFADYGDNRVKQAVDFFLAQRPGVEFTRAENRDAFHGYAAKPPFAFSGRLIEAAHGHNLLMRQYDQQSHRIADQQGNPILDDHGDPVEQDLRGRIDATGYDGGSLAESVFAYAQSMVHAHAGFAIDYGQGVRAGDTRPYLGHRLNLMAQDGDVNRDYREVGIDVIEDQNGATAVGPKLVTIDFAKAFTGPTVFVTGVCYDDADRDGVYDAGEGLAGVRIELDTTSTFAISSASGGYAIPVTGNGTVRVTATGAPSTPGADVIGTQTLTVSVNGANVKADFGRPPDPPFPAQVTFASASATGLTGGASVVSQIQVPAQPEDADLVGDVEVEVHADHAQRADLTLTLVPPAGPEVVLFERAPPGAGLSGVFDSSLTPRGDLGTLEGTAIAGTWGLRVAVAEGGASGTLTSWSLRIRPRWVRTLASSATPLFVTKLKMKDSPLAAADAIVFKAEVDVEGVALDQAAPCELRVLAADATHAVLASAVVPAASITYGANGTSRTFVSAKLAGLEFAAPPPASAEVELAIGGAILRRVVPLTRGGFNGAALLPPGDVLHVGSVVTKIVGSVRTVTVKGRLGTAGTLFGTGVFEVALGALRFKDAMDALKATPAKGTFKSGAAVRKFVVAPATGAFTLVIVSDADLAPGDATELSIRLGEGGFFGATRFTPREAGSSLTY